ncbi:unnamed protein product [Cercopithifilaria johnstoni]|uniref:EF-hand domain-containing protein n=1 Tax=Cercopithifilaria johnstoni TaxID=2874296 RepID=A0A8J2MKI8_9BILA|nr:unnamed protein product [Cercopithifilaria johnstoni]
MIQSKDRNNDEKLNKAEFVKLLLIRNANNQNEDLFKLLDRNGDGVITPTEAMTWMDNKPNKKIIHDVFQLIDINNDKKITLNELTSAMNSGAQQKLTTQMRKRQNLAHQLITLIDQNSDQKLSLQEVHSFAIANNKKNKTGIVKEFEYIDSNQDGFLTINEIIEKPEKVIALVHFQEPPPVINN